MFVARQDDNSNTMTQPNTLFYGDNLPVLCEHIATVQQLLDGATLKLPPPAITFKQAEKAVGPDDSQLGFRFGQ